MKLRENRELKSFYEELGEKYPEEGIVYNTLSGVLRKEFITSKLLSMRSSLLDIGCGAGVYCKVYGNEGYIGIDISASIIKRTKKMFPDDNFVVCDAQNICIRDNSMDNVLCSEVLEHLPDPIKCLKEICRALRTGRILLVTVPNFLN